MYSSLSCIAAFHNWISLPTPIYMFFDLHNLYTLTMFSGMALYIHLQVPPQVSHMYSFHQKKWHCHFQSVLGACYYISREYKKEGILEVWGLKAYFLMLSVDVNKYHGILLIIPSILFCQYFKPIGVRKMVSLVENDLAQWHSLSTYILPIWVRRIMVIWKLNKKDWSKLALSLSFSKGLPTDKLLSI